MNRDNKKVVSIEKLSGDVIAKCVLSEKYTDRDGILDNIINLLENIYECNLDILKSERSFYTVVKYEDDMEIVKIECLWGSTYIDDIAETICNKLVSGNKKKHEDIDKENPAGNKEEYAEAVMDYKQVARILAKYILGILPPSKVEKLEGKDIIIKALNYVNSL